MRVFQISELGIWTLVVDPNFRWVYAAGKQGEVTAMSLVEPDSNYCVCRLDNSVLGKYFILLKKEIQWILYGTLK